MNKYFAIIMLLGTLSLTNTVKAQEKPTPRLSIIELKDTNLADALELVFYAGDNPPHVISDFAKNIPVGSISLTNIAWDAALRQISNQYGFKVRRENKIWIVEPRVLTN